MKKRVLSMLLVLVMLLGVLPVQALAVDMRPVERVSTGEKDPVQITKSLESNGDGTYRITMESYVTGTVVQGEPEPLDIVLVLDQSGSMAFNFNGEETGDNTARRQYAMKNAVKSFIGKVADHSPENYISVVTFASNASILADWTKVTTEGEAALIDSINGLRDSPQGATDVAAGMTMANSLLESANNNYKKFVIVFTDGVPTTQSDFNTGVATNAIQAAKDMKDAGATVYTIGIFNGADPSQLYGDKWSYTVANSIPCDGEEGSYWGGSWLSEFVGENDFEGIDIPAGNRFLNYLSSNFTTADEIGLERGSFNPGNVPLGGGKGYKITKNFEGSASGHYLIAADGNSLYSIFGQIAESIVPAVTAGSDTVLSDTLTDQFEFALDAEGATKGLTAAVYSASGSGEAPVWTEVQTTAVTPVVAGRTVTANGFDYSANPVVLKNGSWSGQKLVITFDIQPDVDATWEKGAHLYDTNNTTDEKAGLKTVNGAFLAALDQSPEVEVTAYGVTYEFTGSVPEGVTPPTDATGYLPGATVTVAEKPSQDGYIFSDWKKGNEEVTTPFSMPTEDVTLTGTWELIPTYTLTYDENGGVGGPNDVNGLTVQDDYTLATAPVPTHEKTVDNIPVVFIGWTAEKDTKIYTKDDTAPTCITTVNIAGNTTVYAVYGLDTNNNGTADVLEEKYTVTYQYTNTVAGAPAVPAQVTGVLAGATVNVAAVPTLAGYTFDGWKKDNVKVTAFPMPAENVTLTGTWELIPVSGLSVTKDVYAINNVLVDANKSYTVNANDVVTWKITVSNEGNVALRGVSVEDTLTIGKTSVALKLYDADGNQVTSLYLAAKGEDGAVKVLYASYKVTAKDQGYKLAYTVVADAGDNGPKDSDTNDDFKVKDAIVYVPTLNKKDHVAYIIGYEDDTVRPENNITRAEVATIFFRLLTDDSRARYWSQTNDFSDVSSSDWFNNAVSTMANAGILTGYPDGTFKPNAPITRAEFAAIAARFSDVSYNGSCSFTDVAKTHWAADEIALAEHLGWITGYPDDTFRPGRNITRAEAMTLINRVLERAVEEDHMHKDMVKWIDNSPSAWYYEAVQEATNSHTYTRLSKKVPGQSFCYEDWTGILKAPDWAALEKSWSDANDR